MPSNSQTELRSWQKRLDILQQENVLLKHKVTELIKEGINSLVLEKVEFYLSTFLDKDAVFALLRHEIANLQRETDKNLNLPAHGVTELKTERLRADIAKMEMEFYKLKTEFTNYVSGFVPAN